MVTEGIINIIFGIVEGLLAFLPEISWNVDGSLFDIFFDVLEMVCYLLPMGTIITIIHLVISFIMFRVVVSLIKTIWELLPLV